MLSKGTSNEGRASQYRGVGVVEDRPCEINSEFLAYLKTDEIEAAFAQREKEITEGKHDYVKRSFTLILADPEGNKISPEQKAEARQRAEHELDALRNSKITETCRHCKRPFHFYEKIIDREGRLEQCPSGWIDSMNHCLPCLYHLEELRIKQKRAQRFLSMNPESEHYGRGGCSNPPKPKQHNDVLAWNRDEETGLILFGGTGTGKTTSLYRLFEEVAIETDFKCKIVRAGELARKIPKACFENEIEDLMDKLLSVDLLGLDDFDKARFTPRVGAELFDLFEARITSGRPTFFTTNMVGTQLEAAFEENIGAAFVRRMRQYCKAIDFDA